MITESESLRDRAREFHYAIAHRAHNLFEVRGREHGHDLDDWLQAESEVSQPITIETEESADAFTLRARVPAFNASLLEVWASPQAVAVGGSSEEKSQRTESGALSSEEEYREGFSLVEIPFDVDVARATATLEKGVLEVVIPRRQEE